ncbi:unnamed protein product [Cuscuta campestris]|uniref:Uncharacterized protein n=1 Tax=Cuscuta campestris TaxID=132261 RepID=A0A484KNG5_9ASTE|nr:unnamed protein product [Cuscuta campestris]
MSSSSANRNEGQSSNQRRRTSCPAAVSPATRAAISTGGLHGRRHSSGNPTVASSRVDKPARQQPSKIAAAREPNTEQNRTREQSRRRKNGTDRRSKAVTFQSKIQVQSLS